MASHAKAPHAPRAAELEAFETEARAAGRAPARYAVDWLPAHAGVTSVVLGVQREHSFEEVFDDR